MAGKAASGRVSLEPDHPLRALYRQAGKRWLILLVSLALLTWLGLFAGMVRNPGGVKRTWAVLASRAMAAAGAVFLVRLLLFSYEERVPVLYVRLARAPEVAAFLERLGRRQDATVPLVDIVAFMAERRYVPRGGMGLILEAATPDDIKRLGPAAGSLCFTLLLPPEGLGGGQEVAGIEAYPGLAIGAALDKLGPGPGDHPERALKLFAEASLKSLGKQPVCAAFRGYTPPDPKVLADATAYSCFLGGSGFNRFGDTPYLVRPLDVTPIFEAGKHTGLNLRIYTGIFKGRFGWWPVAALLAALGASPQWD